MRTERSRLFALGIAIALFLSVGLAGLFPFRALASEETERDASGESADTSDGADPSLSDVDGPQSGETAASLLGRKLGVLGRSGAPSPVRGPIANGVGYPNWGPGYSWMHNIGGTGNHWLGKQKPTSRVEWCINLDSPAPEGAGTPTARSPRPLSSDPEIASMQVTSNEQMGWIIKYVEDTYANSIMEWQAVANAAVSTIAHLSYELGGGVQYLPALEESLRLDMDGQSVAHNARALVARAKLAAGAPAASATVVVEENHQDFVVTNIGVKQSGQNNWLGGIPVTVTIESDNAVFSADKVTSGEVSEDGLTWTGTTTAGSPLEIPGHSTKNGEITTQVKFFDVETSSIEGLKRSNGTQDTIAYKVSSSDPSVTTEREELVYDFQPTAVSDVGDARLLAPGTDSLKDTLTVSVEDDEVWLGNLRTYPNTIAYEPLEVKFKGTAYYHGTLPPAPVNAVPQDAIVVAEAEIFADGPGQYPIEAELDRSAMTTEGGFVTWVWEMDKTDQPKIDEDDLYMLRADWSDGFGTTDEVTSVQWPGKIESNVKIHPTVDNTYLVDDVWLSGMPSDHPSFAGGHTFGSDAVHVQQELYFWPEKTMDEVDSLADATLIGSVDIPARNGFYPSVGDLEFKLQRDSEGNAAVGTYQFVHSFPGDDRVAPFQSQIPDVTEMYEVLPDPQIGTNATGSAGNIVGAFEDVTITDEVCYLNLTAGKQYELSGVLIDKDTGEPLLVDGQRVTASKQFVPTASEGCENVEFSFDGSALAGTTIVVFEDLLFEGVEVATHADIEDEAQTVYVPEIGTDATGSVENIVGAFEDVTITDRVCYSNLVPGRDYELSGTLMDQATDQPLLVDGEQVTADKQFVPTSSEACVDLEFTFDGSALAGTTVVVFEDLLFDGVRVAAHADIEDEAQTVYVPEIGTTATSEDGEKTVKPVDSVTLVDEVCYSNLVPGRDYELEGILMDKSTGDPLLDGDREVTSTVTFARETSDGCVDMEFTFDASSLGGRDLVVFEDLYREDVLIAVHADIDDAAQTVRVEPDEPGPPAELPKTGLVHFGLAGLGALFALGGGALLGHRRKL